MKICIVSDSHDNRKLLDEAVLDAKNSGAEAVLHCGDVVAPTTLRVLQKHGLPVHVIHGNNTGDLYNLTKLSHEPDSVVEFYGHDAGLELAGKKIFLVHGESKSLLNLKKELLSFGVNEVEILEYGKQYNIEAGRKL